MAMVLAYVVDPCYVVLKVSFVQQSMADRGPPRGDRGDRGGRGDRGDRGRGRGPRRPRGRKDEEEKWVPCTKLGRLVSQVRRRCSQRLLSSIGFACSICRCTPASFAVLTPYPTSDAASAPGMQTARMHHDVHHRCCATKNPIVCPCLPRRARSRAWSRSTCSRSR